MLLFEYFRRQPRSQATTPPKSTPHPTPTPPTRAQAADTLAKAVNKRASALFTDRKLLCAEAILVAINETFGTPLTEDRAVGAAAGLTAGLGDQGCLCGAIAGACLSVGILCAAGSHAATRAAVRRASADIHAAFTAKYKSACCRVLSRPVKDDAAAHMAQCAALTGFGAELACRAILRLRPEWSENPGALTVRSEKRLCARVKWLFSFFCRS